MKRFTKQKFNGISVVNFLTDGKDKMIKTIQKLT